MIDVKLLKNTARMSLRLNSLSELVFGKITKSEAKTAINNSIAEEIAVTCKACKKKLNNDSDEFKKVKK